MSANEHMEKTTINNDEVRRSSEKEGANSYIKDSMTQHLTISVLAAKLHNLHRQTVQPLAWSQSKLCPVICPRLHVTASWQLEVDSLIPDRTIATQVRDWASNPLTECMIDCLIEWPRARVILRSSDQEWDWFSDRVTDYKIVTGVSPTAFHNILA